MKSQGASVVLRLLAVLLIFLGAVCGAFAQSNTGTMLGTVKDSSGAVVSGATVTARNTETNATRSFTTGDDGAFRIPNLQVGAYELRAEHDGFKAEVHSGLTLTVSQEEAVNFALEVGATQQTVSVTGEVTLVDTTSSAVGGTVNQSTLVDLPLNGRSYEDLTMLQPGVSDNKNQNNANRGSSGHYFSSNGAQVRSNNYYLDGTSLVNPYGASSSSIAGTTLGVDGIQEYRVITSGIPAELGMVSGSQMLMVSKGGTNNFHGTAFEFMRNSALDARNYFDYGFTLFPGARRLPEFQRNNFGGSFGGPIKKDKLFFYTSYEGLRESLGIAVNTPDLPAGTDAFGNAVPGGACRGVAGAILTAGNAVGQCSLFLQAANATAGQAAVVAGQTFTVAPVMAPFLSTKLYPIPNAQNFNTKLYTNYAYPFQQPSVEDYGQGRMDYNLSASDTLFARFTADYATQVQNQAYPEYVANLQTIGEWLTLGENHIFSPSLLNTFRASFSRSDIIGIPAYAPGVNESLYLDTQLTPGQPLGGLSSSQTGGSGATQSFTGAAGATGPIIRNQNIFAGQDDLNYTRGKHSFKFGVLMNHYLQFADSDASLKGTVSFTNFGQYVQGLYSALGGALSGPGINPELEFERSINYTTIGVYGQDDWRITPRLTLNLGLRYEIMTMPFEKYGQWSAYQQPAILQPVTMTVTPHGQLYAKNPSLRNFGPRIGFAWDVFGNGKTSVRGAYDLLYDLGDVMSQWLQTDVAQPPFAFRAVTPPTITIASQAGNNLVLPFNLCNNNCAGATFPFVTDANGNVSAGNGANRPLDYFQKQPYLHLWNLTVDRQLPWSSVLTVSYVGSRGIHLMDDVDGNPTIPLGYQPNGYGTACVAKPGVTAANALTTVNASSMVDGSATACWLPGPLTNPRVDTKSTLSPSWTDTYTSRADSWYNALQVGFTKRMSKGLQLQASYTWARAFDTNPGQLNPDQNSTSSLNTADPINLYYDRGRSSTDIPHNFKVSVLYYLPNVKSDNKFAKGFANGWWVSGVWTNLSGFGFSPSVVNNVSNSLTANVNGAGGLDRPNYAPGFDGHSNITSGVEGRLRPDICVVNGVTQKALPAGTALGTVQHWYNPCAFALQPVGFLGTVARDSITGPTLRNLDFSLVKDTGVRWLGEAGTIQFRTEVFNAFNHANFALPPGHTTPGYLAAPNSAEGVLTSTVGKPRNIQFALKIIF